MAHKFTGPKPETLLFTAGTFSQTRKVWSATELAEVRHVRSNTTVINIG